MPFQWVGGQPPQNLTPKKVLVLGPDEMFDSDYPFVKKVLDDFTLKLEHFHVVVLGDGRAWRATRISPPKIGIDHLAIRWADYYKYTRSMLPLRNYDSGKERNRDLKDTLGEWGAFCCWFRDEQDQVSEWVYNNVVQEVVSPKRTRVVRI